MSVLGRLILKHLGTEPSVLGLYLFVPVPRDLLLSEPHCFAHIFIERPNELCLPKANEGAGLTPKGTVKCYLFRSYSCWGCSLGTPIAQTTLWWGNTTPVGMGPRTAFSSSHLLPFPLHCFISQELLVPHSLARASSSYLCGSENFHNENVCLPERAVMNPAIQSNRCSQ